ncbi:putative monooxygenase [Pseudoclavibacter endophyticus]|uniref:FAD-binding monooxygenase n=1 Tax=Pseudoclavibacter endophyticus TaxID=1778590 RepID=A0A6H9WP32_9MICO|nr:FAD-dependent monooxygenase [Pseudoclavibacter endophyticus]KAB1649481.1 FAD-binding monooxygenase [Pseudoclavibacter endophyticus]GGA62295.1 putative monooxygenase [Pseudoclavibacter endophyticus]
MPTLHIVGGGIAGLTLAASLRADAGRIVVHEQGRPPGEREVDTAFGLWPPAMKALARIDLAQTVYERAARLTGAAVSTADGRVLRSIRNQHMPMIGRVTLRGILRDALPEHVEWHDERINDSRALSGTADGDGDGDAIIVGADGARSVVRADHWGARAASRTAGTTVVRGIVDAAIAADSLAEYWGDGVLFGITPLSGGRTNWFAEFRERRFADRAEALEYIRMLGAGFPQTVRDVLDAASPERMLVSGVHVARPLARLVRGRAVLIGDAAHAMTPNLGRGACESICDAVALGTLLNAHPGAPDIALRRYNAARLLKPQVIRAGSTAVGRVALARGRTAELRDRLLGARAKELRRPR